MMIYNAVRLTIGEQQFEGLRVEFDIERATSLYARAILSVYNMSKESYDALKYNALSVVEILTAAGWQKLFTGSFRLQQMRKNGGDTIVTVHLFESVTDYKQKFSFSLDEGATGNDVIKHFKDEMPTLDFIISDEAQSKIDGLTFPGGYTSLVGSYYDLLIDFIKDHIGKDFEPYFDNSKVVIGVTSKTPIDINVETGMIGSPEYYKIIAGKSGRSEFRGTVLHRLLPSVSIYDVINIKSEYFIVSNADVINRTGGFSAEEYENIKRPGNGLYIAKKINHRGDTHGNTWETKIEFIGKQSD